MAGGDHASPAKEEREMAGIDVEEEDGWATADASECGSESDDTEVDPTFDVLELTRSKLSKMSLRKSRPRIREVIAMPQLNTKEKKCFETVEKMIKDGELDKLKLEECKLYLRKYGLRMTGNKNVLQARIKEHLEVMDGGGEKKYPVSSFVLNCKGDACMGDVVMFEQNVYDMYNVASRSATAPPCGTRTVAGRIVKESYGAAKQQHTFTVEVLWSKGEKPLPPLHPLLIKGRNLYRLKTMRQRWEDEEERNRVLQEKHRRGSIARCSREVRIRGKEMKNMTGGKRRQAVVSEKNAASGAQNTRHQPLTSHKSLPAGAQNTQHQAVVSEKSTVAGAQNTWHQALVSDMRTSAGAQNILHQALVSQNLGSPRYMPGFHGGHGDGFADRRPLRNLNSSFLPGPPPLGSRIHPNDHQESGFCRGQQQPWRNFNSPCRGRNQNYADVGFCSPSKGGPQNLRRHPCRWHLQGRCWYGENCRYQH